MVSRWSVWKHDVFGGGIGEYVVGGGHLNACPGGGGRRHDITEACPGGVEQNGSVSRVHLEVCLGRGWFCILSRYVYNYCHL